MADIYVLSLATTNDTFTPFFFHSFEKAQGYMLEWFDHFLRTALDPYDHILGEDNRATKRSCLIFKEVLV